MSEKLLSFDESGFQYAWDSTSLTSFEKCPRYYQLKHIQGWQSVRKSEHLVFGGIYASSLELFYKQRAHGVEFDDALRNATLHAMTESWEHERDAEGNRIVDTGGPWESTIPAKTRDTLVRSVVWYIDNFKDDPMPTLTLGNGQAACEYSFSVELSDEYLYCGHIDRMVQYNGNFVMDQKTSGATITPRFFDGFDPDTQMSGYVFAGKIVFDLPVSGVVIDAAQIAVGFTSFTRGFIHRSAAQLEEWKQDALASIAEAKRAHESGHYRKRTTSCGNYGGCEFRKICSRNPEHRQKLLEQDFVQAPRWDPLQKR